MASRAKRNPGRTRALLLSLAAVVSVVAVGVGTAVATPVQAPLPPLSAALTSADTKVMQVARLPFCDAVPAADVAKALAVPASKVAATAWLPGDPVPGDTTSGDVSDEFGCSWTAPEGASDPEGSSAVGTTASAWLFAPAVIVDRAKALAAAVPDGCSAVADAPAFGSISSAYVCDATATASAGTTFRGLFGDAWLSCSLMTSSVDLTGRFCLAVAQSAAPVA